jgi:cell wall-associated NlpC family hydrolase
VTVSSIRARHRSARRPTTALNDLANAATGSIGIVGRRTAVVAASSGLIVTMLSSPASAGSGGAEGSVDTTALTASARAVLDTAPVVTSPADAQWTYDDPSVTAVVPTRAAIRTAATSRSVVRTAVVNSPIPQSVAGNAVLEIAARYVGTPYVYGGSTPSGFDCSGFVSYVYAQLGISLPRTTSGIRAVGHVVSRANALPGDLIYTAGHVAIYAGGNQEIDAPRPGKTVQFRAIWQTAPVFLRIG